MDPTASDPREDPERAPAQGFQSEDGEHTRFRPPAEVSRPAGAYQHEDDDRLAFPID